MNEDNRVNTNKTKPYSILMSIWIFVTMCCLETLSFSPAPEVPATLPETKLPKPRGQKGHTFDPPLPQPWCFLRSWPAQCFGLMNSASLAGACRCLSQLPWDYSYVVTAGKVWQPNCLPQGPDGRLPRRPWPCPGLALCVTDEAVTELTEASFQLDQLSIFAFCDYLRIIFQSVPSFIVQLNHLPSV